MNLKKRIVIEKQKQNNALTIFICKGDEKYQFGLLVYLFFSLFSTYSRKKNRKKLFRHWLMVRLFAYDLAAVNFHNLKEKRKTKFLKIPKKLTQNINFISIENFKFFNSFSQQIIFSLLNILFFLLHFAKSTNFFTFSLFLLCHNFLTYIAIIRFCMCMSMFV